jgi:hypothetical protein
MEVQQMSIGIRQKLDGLRVRQVWWKFDKCPMDSVQQKADRNLILSHENAMEIQQKFDNSRTNIIW